MMPQYVFRSHCQRKAPCLEMLGCYFVRLYSLAYPLLCQLSLRHAESSGYLNLQSTIQSGFVAYHGIALSLPVNHWWILYSSEPLRTALLTSWGPEDVYACWFAEGGGFQTLCYRSRRVDVQGSCSKSLRRLNAKDCDK